MDSSRHGHYALAGAFVACVVIHVHAQDDATVVPPDSSETLEFRARRRPVRADP
jgi:hypothetical protein